MNFNSSSKLDRVMTPEQFTQVVEAILAGKYSWACVLILRFAGYNPLHYIPYRTYNRLMKENCPAGRWSRQADPESPLDPSHRDLSESSPAQTIINPGIGHQKCEHSINDLEYLELAGPRSQQETQGGHSNRSGFAFHDLLLLWQVDRYN